MRIMQYLWSSLLRSDIKEIISSGLRLGAPACVLAAAILMLLLAAAGTAFGGSATWRFDPGNSSWNVLEPENWTPETVPNGPADTATFDVSNVTGIGLTQNDIEVSGIVFNAGASAFSIDVLDGDGKALVALTISGVGITNNSGITQNFTTHGDNNTGGDSALRFTNNATAGNLTVLTADVDPQAFRTSTISFENDSTADGARVKVFGIFKGTGGTLDISGHNAPGVTIGSIEGTGLVFLGANNLTVGTNSLNTTFSGAIQDGGSFTKVGRGTLILTNANTYTGGTTIDDGTFVVNNLSGSGTGTGAVQVNGGVLGGRGIIAGAVTVGNGSGTRAELDPGKPGSDPGHFLSILGALILNSDGTYTVGLKTRNQIVDQVMANGITINGAQFHFTVHGQQVLSPGTVFTVLENTAATPIAGAFSNLPDGSLITANSNTFQASYTGGDGNDLTLTVVP